MRTMYCLLLMLCPYFTMAQNSVLRSIHPGEKAPAIMFPDILNYKSNTASLSGFSGKLLILDFWATWCSACIKKFNLLDSMQLKYPNQLQVLLVNAANTRDTKQKIEDFFLRHKNSRGSRLGLPTVYNDTTAGGYFPYEAIPHYVWIDPAQQVLAITGPDEVTAKNIEAVINGQPHSFAGLGLMDSFIDSLPLFVQGNAGNGTGLRFRSTLSSFIPGMRSFSRTIRTTGNLVTQHKMINASLLQLLNRAYSYTGRDDRIQLAVPDSIKELLFPPTDSAKKSNSYAYEIICLPVPVTAMRRYMQQDLERWFGLAGKYQTGPAPAYLLTVDTMQLRQHRTAGSKRSNHLNDAGNKYMLNASLGELADYLNNSLGKYVVQQGSVAYQLDICLPPIPVADSPQFFDALAAMGIRLTPATQNIQQFIIYQLPKQQLP